MSPIPRTVAAGMAGLGCGALVSGRPDSVQDASWLLLGAAFYAWLGWRK